MLKNLKFLPVMLVMVFLSFSLAFSIEKEKVFEERTVKENSIDEKVLIGKEVIIPKDTTATPQNYHIPWSSLNGGGKDMASTSYKAMVSSAQSFIGESQSTNYQLKIGYWYGGKPFLCADVNETGNVSLGDIVYLINYLFKLGPEPDPFYGDADANGDGKVSLGDIVWLINYLFKLGPSPVC
jgi:hypothetical protein